MRSIRRGLLAALLVLPACGDGAGPAPPAVQTEYVTRRRPWAPGERDAAIARILRTRQLTLPYAGDVSDYIGFLLDPDSAVELVPNPALNPSLVSPFGPAYSLNATRVPGTGWTAAGVDIRIVNNNQAPPDTLDWLGWFWWNDADSTRKGFVFVVSRNTTVAATGVNTTAFDASGAKAGAGGGESQGATLWLANGWVRRNTASVTQNFAFTGATTVTSGPFLGGTQQIAFMSGVLDSVRMDRVLGSGTPNPQYASATFSFIGSIRLTCIFPTPCTTNVPLMAAAARRGPLPDSLRSRLPWAAPPR